MDQDIDALVDDSKIPCDKSALNLILKSLKPLEETLEMALRDLREIASHVERKILGAENKNTDNQRKGSLTTLRDVVSKVKHIQKYLDVSFATSIADISQRSNAYISIARLPEEIFTEILSRHVEAFQEGYIHTKDPHRGWAPGFRDDWHRNNWKPFREVCRSWDDALTGCARFWAFVCMSWPMDLIRAHTSLSRDVHLRVYSPGIECVNAAQTTWIMTNIQSIENLQIGPTSASYRVPRLTVDINIDRFLSQCPVEQATELRALVLLLPLQSRGSQSSWQINLAAPKLRDLHLRNCWYMNYAPSQLQVLDVTFDDGTVGVGDLLQFLSGTPQLKSCKFYVMSAIHSPSLESHHEISIQLPGLHTLVLSGLPAPQLHWLYDRILAGNLVRNDVSISPLSNSNEPLDLPAPLQGYAMRSDSLDIRPKYIVYQLIGQFHHTFRMDDGTDDAREHFPNISLIIPYFRHIRKLILEPCTPSGGPDVLTALQTFEHLQDLHLCGSESYLSLFLLDMAQADPMPCPKLISLTLEDDGYWKWGMAMDNRYSDTLDRLEVFLKSRVDRASALERLILSENNIWMHDVDRWKKHVGVVERCRPENLRIRYLDYS
ncbi:hypothetical protein SISSUDRAFT_1064807 [Sistotremastrum suecicum HHB10207 ss-3]|uniref:F-box domain-containing protein n=1 Tax=Sistotremastrum suecicum HHB10207 ss-3 TaxID=1314776 RepID=A0A166A700_9AGAM|nr:hypothetical protein SISSUDRAFT_1064807 [Sistotremastrum suecicum HHB10207 ss-3]